MCFVRIKTMLKRSHICQLLRILTGLLCLLGFYGLFLILVAQYYAILRLGFQLNIQLSGLISFVVAAAWVYVFGYITIYSMLPSKRITRQR